MKAILNFIVNFVQKKGILKIFLAFMLLMISALIIRSSVNPVLVTIFTWIGGISLIYIVLVVLVFLIIGIINAIKDKK